MKKSIIATGAPIYAKNRAAWRSWLKKNHDRSGSVELIIYHKASSTPSVRYPEAVEEALCFGWVDSKPSRRDSESYTMHFARRNPRSNWSRLNRQRAEAMVTQGKMTEAGTRAIALAKKTGRWKALELVQNLTMPADLKRAFRGHRAALRFFNHFTPSAKRSILEWILGAKKQETRRERIRETVRQAANNLRANQYRP